MGTLHTISAPPPSLYVVGDRPPVANAYFAVSVDAAIDLLEAREYRDLPRSQRLAKAQAEQQAFLNEFLDPALGLALDLRIAADPAASSPLSATLLGRVWGGGVEAVTARAESLRSRVRAAVPRHVTAGTVEDAEAVKRLLTPFGGAPVDSAVIARHELISPPARPDAGVSYYYSAVPFNLADSDWSAVYSALAASRVPVVLSVAVMPMTVPPPFAQALATLATYYGRLAKEGEHDGGPYRGMARLAPDAFAVEAEKTFNDYYRRLSQQAFALRIQVSAARQLPTGIVETIADAISPAERSGGPGDRQAALQSTGPQSTGPQSTGLQSTGDQRTATREVRQPASVAERRLAEYNLNVINLGMLTGRPEIWGRQDPPDWQLAMLAVLADAREASCAFRFPIAVDGTVPGFPVRRGLFGQAAAYQLTGQVIRLGKAPGSSRDISVPLRSLARHALVVGSAGSGKTATAVEILRQLWTDHGIPFLVIAPASADADAYRELAAEPGFETLELVTAGDEGGAPLRFNPFEVPEGMLVGEHVTNLLGCFTAAFGLPWPLSSVYLDALNLTYLRSGFLATERVSEREPEASAGNTEREPKRAPLSPGLRREGATEERTSDEGGGRGLPRAEASAGNTVSAGNTDSRAWPTVVDFLAAMEEVTAELRSAGDAGAGVAAGAVRRARQLLRGTSGSAFLTDRPADVRRLLDHPVILGLGPRQAGAGAGDEQALLMALLLNAVTEHSRLARGASSHDLAHVTLVEEADRLLGRAQGRPAADEAQARESAAAAFATALSESRRHGEGVILAGQFPGKLVAEAVKGSNLKLMHRLTDEEDRRYLGEIMGLDEAQRLFAAKLRSREALLYSDESTEAAHVSLVGTPQAGPRAAGGLVAEPTTGPATVPPFAACADCRAQCAYRGAALSMLDDPAIAENITRAATATGEPAEPAVGPEDLGGLTELRRALHTTVARFAALPAADPGRSDAAFCLFLHVHATSGLRAQPHWPAVAAKLLGITGELPDQVPGHD